MYSRLLTPDIRHLSENNYHRQLHKLESAGVVAFFWVAWIIPEGS